MQLKIIGLILLLGIYITVFLFYFIKRQRNKKVEDLIGDFRYKDKVKSFYFEAQLLKRLNLTENKAKVFLAIERVALIGSLVLILTLYRGVSLFFIGCILIGLIFRDLTKKAVFDSGITNIPNIMNFINYFVPHINSGNSANQSFLGYIDYSNNNELREYYENIDNPEYKIPSHLKQIIDIYDIARYNEEKGISDYIYILDELTKDIGQKQTYYNSYISRIGEIKPICWSYYIGVPVLIIVSFSTTYSFWMGKYGWLCSLVLLILFLIFKFLIYKLEKDTINTIF